MVGLLLCFLPFFSSSAQALPDKILVILPAATTLELKGGKSFETGTYLNEFALPLLGLEGKGVKFLYFTPGGRTPHLDADSVQGKYFKNDPQLLRRAQELFASIGKSAPLASLAQARQGDLSDVAAIFVPGGHAPLIDLVSDADLGELLRRAHQRQVTTALICHGPIALLSAAPKAQNYLAVLKRGEALSAASVPRDWPYAGYRMTIFSDAEEKQAEVKKLKGQVTFFPATALAGLGGKVESAGEWTSHVVIDRELITGQNPNSVDEFSLALASKVIGHE